MCPDGLTVTVVITTLTSCYCPCWYIFTAVITKLTSCYCPCWYVFTAVITKQTGSTSALLACRRCDGKTGSKYQTRQKRENAALFFVTEWSGPWHTRGKRDLKTLP